MVNRADSTAAKTCGELSSTARHQPVPDRQPEPSVVAIAVWAQSQGAVYGFRGPAVGHPERALCGALRTKRPGTPASSGLSVLLVRVVNLPGFGIRGRRKSQDF